MTVTVYVWEPWYTNTGNAGIGHASLKIGGQYLSYWPISASFTPVGAMFFSQCAFQTFDEDKKAEAGPPMHTTHLQNLDEKRIQTFVNSWLAKKPPYHPKLRNCSHPVKIALYEGTGRKIGPNFEVKTDPVYQISDQLNMDILGYKLDLRGGDIEKIVRKTWNPIDVDKYAKQLKKQIG